MATATSLSVCFLVAMVMVWLNPGDTETLISLTSKDVERCWDTARVCRENAGGYDHKRRKPVSCGEICTELGFRQSSCYPNKTACPLLAEPYQCNCHYRNCNGRTDCNYLQLP